MLATLNHGLTALLLLLVAAPSVALAHGPRDIDLHVGDAHEECYFDLHPELTRAQLRTFAAEAGLIARFRQTTSADTLGAGNFDVSLGYTVHFIDDSKGAWNNTMSHPQGDHYLGERLAIPALALGVGLGDDIDLEAYGTLNPSSNYGLLGIATKIRLLEQSDEMPVSLSVRPSLGALVGPTEVQVYNFSTDVAVSRSFHGLAPFAGITLSTTAVVEASPDTDIGHQSASTIVGFAGVDYRWRFLSVGAQAEVSNIASLSLRASGRF